MQYLIGLILSVAVAGFAMAIGLHRERGFYPPVIIAIATHYVLFAAIGGSSRALLLEILVAAGFLLLAVLGFKKSLWFAATAIAGHGIFDLVHHRLIDNAGVPHWWPGFCATFDVIFGAWLAVRLMNPLKHQK